MKRIILAAALAGSGISASAPAATITYQLGGSFGGSLNGKSFDFDAVFTGIGDPKSGWSSIGAPYRDLMSLRFVVDGIPYSSAGPAYFYGDGGFQDSGFGTLSSGYFIAFSGLNGYDGISNLASTPVSFEFPADQPLLTDHGAVYINRASGLTFSATVSGVPETSSWAMIIGGFALGGAALRRTRHKFAVTLPEACA
ncbi:hypothetical protein [Sphingomonas trueperi]|uniref:hypothetical protein n=1 Tax=Sphingomonas trueperi TaxID=53317 RepID=UPI001601904F